MAFSFITNKQEFIDIFSNADNHSKILSVDPVNFNYDQFNINWPDLIDLLNDKNVKNIMQTNFPKPYWIQFVTNIMSNKDCHTYCANLLTQPTTEGHMLEDCVQIAANRPVVKPFNEARDKLISLSKNWLHHNPKGVPFDWTNIICAGGAVCRSLIDINEPKQFDIDLFIYSLSRTHSEQILQNLLYYFHTPTTYYCCNGCIVDIFVDSLKFQIICSTHANPYEILYKFDYTHIMCGFNGTQFLLSPPFIKGASICASYPYSLTIFIEYRLLKANLMGFKVVSNMDIIANSFKKMKNSQDYLLEQYQKIMNIPELHDDTTLAAKALNISRIKKYYPEHYVTQNPGSVIVNMIPYMEINNLKVLYCSKSNGTLTTNDYISDWSELKLTRFVKWQNFIIMNSKKVYFKLTATLNEIDESQRNMLLLKLDVSPEYVKFIELLKNNYITHKIAEIVNIDPREIIIKRSYIDWCNITKKPLFVNSKGANCNINDIKTGSTLQIIVMLVVPDDTYNNCFKFIRGVVL